MFCLIDLWGNVEVMLTSADIADAIDAMQKYDISVMDAVCVDDLHLQFSVKRKKLKQLIKLASQRGDRVDVLYYGRPSNALINLLKRPILILGIMLILFLSTWLPSRVLFVCVQGNETIPERLILEYAESCGIRFGTLRRSVRNEKTKNALLDAMPQLQWAGINTYGCTAVITVRERNAHQDVSPERGICHIVALRDGVLRNITILQGTSLCYTGQAVTKGQMLVSGYTDCGICIKGTQAKAEIYGDTMRKLSAIMPTDYIFGHSMTSSSKNFYLILGKKRINLSKGSGILGVGCAKIYEEKYLTLPGGYVLPIAIAWETAYEYETKAETVDSWQQILMEFAAQYLPKQMLAGDIMKSEQIYAQTESFCRLDGVYYCYEIIGITHEEALITEHE